MIRTLEERERRIKLKKDVYEPNDGQLPVHKSVARTRAVFSGNGGGKTTLGVHEALWAAEGYNPVTGKFTKVPATVIVVLDKPDKVRKVWLPEMRKWRNINDDQLWKDGKPEISRMSFPNGSQIIYMTHEMEPLSFESIEVDFVVFDEPPPRHVYIALLRGGRKKRGLGRYLIIGTPITGSWLRKEIYEPWTRGEKPNIECFKFGTRVNEKNLAENYIEEFGSALSEKEKRIRLEGDFFDLDGLALAHLFDRKTHVIDDPEFTWDPSWPVVIGIDPHPEKNHVAVMIGVDREERYYVLRELSSKAIPREFARELKNWYKGFRVVDINCDSLGSTKMTGGEGNLSFIEVLRDEGVRARSTTWEDKQDESWTMRIQDVLACPKEADNFGQRIPRLRLLPDCRGSIENIESVSWLKHRNLDEHKPKLDISNKDFLSCIKYALACNLSSRKGKDKIYYRTDVPYGFDPSPRKQAAKALRIRFK